MAAAPVSGSKAVTEWFPTPSLAIAGGLNRRPGPRRPGRALRDHPGASCGIDGAIAPGHRVELVQEDRRDDHVGATPAEELDPRQHGVEPPTASDVGLDGPGAEGAIRAQLE